MPTPARRPLFDRDIAFTLSVTLMGLALLAASIFQMAG